MATRENCLANTWDVSRRTALRWLAGAGLAAAAGAKGTSLLAQGQSQAATSAARPKFHLTPTTGWINDPQPGRWLNGTWNLWVLFNADYPTSGGTAWRHFTSPDLVVWTDGGVAIPKYTNAYGDVWTGSTVLDVDNTAGYGAGTLLAIMTMPCDNTSSDGQAGQNQSEALWYSTDNGTSFTFGGIILPNYPGDNATYRDPSVFWHAPSTQWVMSLAESNKLSIYTSPDLKHWTYRSGLVNDQLGVLECPNLFPLHLYDEQGATIADKWVLLAGANGYRSGRTTGTYYWVGTFDGATFTPDSGSGAWLDFGSDFYACTVFAPGPQEKDALQHATATAWMNNWAYATSLPTHGYYGQLSVTRNLHLQRVNGTATLMNRPHPGLHRSFGSKFQAADQIVSDAQAFAFPQWDSDPVCHIRFQLQQSGGAWPAALFFSFRNGDGYFTQLTFDFGKSNIFLKRDTSGPQPTSDSSWTNNANAPFSFAGTTVEVNVLIDLYSVEVFLDHGLVSISSLITAPADATGLDMSVAGGAVMVQNFVIRPSA